MALNPFFLQGSSGEQNLVQDLINEHLKIYGIEVYYIPRKLLKTDNILNEVESSKFDTSFAIEAYLDNYEGYSPGNDIMSKFGITLKNEITLVISKERFEESISPYLAEIMSISRVYYPGEDLAFVSRPKEGDLIYFPLGERLFEIKRVEVEKPFYQLGKNYVYEILCELFEYEDEEIDTGISEIDNVLEDIGYITDLKLVAFGGTAEIEPRLAYPKQIYSGVSKITLVNDGYGYTDNPTVIIDPPENFGEPARAVAITTAIQNTYSVKEILIVNSGYGYTEPPNVRIVGGNGIGAKAISEISKNVIESLEIKDKGDRYYQPPIITIDPPIGGGVTATAISRIYNGRVSEVFLTNAGSGYTSTPNIVVSPPPSVGFGTYIVSETVVGSLSGTTAEVKSWTNPGKDVDKILRVSINSGSFSEGESIVGTSSSAIYTLKSYDIDTSYSDKYSDNDEIQQEANSILDFTESNPFGTY